MDTGKLIAVAPDGGEHVYDPGIEVGRVDHIVHDPNVTYRPTSVSLAFAKEGETIRFAIAPEVARGIGELMIALADELERYYPPA